MNFASTGFPYEEFKKIRTSARRSNIRRIRNQGRVRRRMEALELQLDEVSRTLAALLAVVEEKGMATREDLVAALDRLEDSSDRQSE